MLKGKTTIELTDVNTGEVQTIEDTNMFTNALNNIVNNSPMILGRRQLDDWMHNQSACNHILPLNKFGLCGLLLFKEKLEENPNLMYVPLTNMPTGIASNNAYSGEDMRRGSFNANESIRIPNGYRFVWDFGTSQANGKISCVSLTHSSAAEVYYGQTPTTTNWEKMFLSYTTDGNNCHGFWRRLREYRSVKPINDDNITIDLYDSFIVDYNEEGPIVLTWNGGYHLVQLFMPLNKIDMFSQVTPYECKLLKKDFGNKFGTDIKGNYYRIKVDNNKVGYWDPGRIIHIYKIDKNTFEDIEEIKTCQTDVCIVRDEDPAKFIIDNTNNILYLPYVESRYSTMNAIDLETGKGESLSIANPLSSFYIKELNAIYLGTSAMYSFDTNQMYTYDDCGKWFVGLENGWAINSCVGYRVGIGVTPYIPYVATINNLENSFVKTENQTMKIIYEVTNG